MLLGNFQKQPGEAEVYGINYDEATDYDEMLTKASAVVENLTGTENTAVVSPCIIVDKQVRVRMSGGADGDKYKITVTVETDATRVLQDELIVSIAEV